MVRPLRAVNRYAAAVAAGEDPPPLRLRHQDELAGMFATLQHMQATLQARINALKAAELTARNNRKQAVQARTQALTSLELAQRASRVQDDFLRRISHEIRTPLNAIIGMSYLSLQTELSGVQRDYLAQINKSGSVLLDMVNRILDFSSASEGHVQLEPQPFVLALQGWLIGFIPESPDPKDVVVVYYNPERTHQWVSLPIGSWRKLADGVHAGTNPFGPIYRDAMELPPVSVTVLRLE